MIRNENGRLAGYVFVDMAGRDMGGYVTEVAQSGLLARGRFELVGIERHRGNRRVTASWRA